MNQKLQKKLFKKYPKIFVQRKLPMSQTAMCWGIDTCDGWYWLIDMLCGRIQSFIDNNMKYSEGKIQQVEATQVKEKFGGLRFYFQGGDHSEYVHGIVSFAEYLSYYICEVCGETKKVKQTKKGWISTLCPKCMKSHYAESIKDYPSLDRILLRKENENK